MMVAYKSPEQFSNWLAATPQCWLVCSVHFRDLGSFKGVPRVRKCLHVLLCLTRGRHALCLLGFSLFFGYLFHNSDLLFFQDLVANRCFFLLFLFFLRFHLLFKLAQSFWGESLALWDSSPRHNFHWGLIRIVGSMIHLRTFLKRGLKVAFLSLLVAELRWCLF